MANIRKEFIFSLEKVGNQRGFEVRKYQSPVRNTNNIIELFRAISCLLYFKIRSAAPYRWGVTRTRVKELEALSQDWFIVLLYETPDNGYLLTADEIGRYLKENLWPLGRNKKNKNEYKVQPGKSLKYHKPFKTFEEFMNSLEQKMNDNIKTING